jgi:hypothetical protein
VFILRCVVLCVGSGLAKGCSPVHGFLPNAYRIVKLKKSGQSSTKGCIAITKIISRQSLFVITTNTLWPECASELHRPSDRHLSAKLVKTFAIKSATWSA